MGINSYNKDEKFSNLINDLNGLPKEKAPDNFEYNLMTRIQNKNFGDVKGEVKENFNLVRFFAPSAAVIAVIIIFFLLLPESNQQIDNPLMTDPPSIAQQNEQAGQQNQLTEAETKFKEQSTTQNSLSGSEKTIPYNNFRAVIKPNDVVEKVSEKYPISRNRSVALDEYISGDSQKGTNLRRGSVVGGADESPEFDGFLRRQQADPQTIQKYREMIDSVKKEQAKEDSLRKIQK